ncbi:MAG TPA: hypothetical protein VHC94_15110 [Nitrobacter sp.]|jgi:hypothetical protein|nr:hypothetical protein [Nitrobacter sp.]
MTTYKLLAAVSLGLMMLTSQASAQCTDCAMYPNRDHLNGGAETPAGRLGLEHSGGAASTYNGANAQMEPQVRSVQPSHKRSTGRHHYSK